VSGDGGYWQKEVAVIAIATVIGTVIIGSGAGVQVCRNIPESDTSISGSTGTNYFIDA
jgi:hypothetical protein